MKPRATQLNNMSNERTCRLVFPVVFLMTTWNQLSLMYLVKATNVHVTADEIETWDIIRKSKKTIVHFLNRKRCKCVLVNRKKMKSFNIEDIVTQC